MCRLSRKTIHCLILAFLISLISGCAASPASAPVLPSNAPSPAIEPLQETPTFNLPARVVSETPIIVTQTLQKTATLLAEPTHTIRPTKPLPAGVDEYVKVVLALMDEHTRDAYEAQKLETLTDQSQIEAFRERAARRLERMRGMQPPPDLQEAHDKIIASFELLISTWDFIKTKEYTAAKETLIQSYEPLVEAIALISQYLYP